MLPWIWNSNSCPSFQPSSLTILGGRMMTHFAYSRPAWRRFSCLWSFTFGAIGHGVLQSYDKRVRDEQRSWGCVAPRQTTRDNTSGGLGPPVFERRDGRGRGSQPVRGGSRRRGTAPYVAPKNPQPTSAMNGSARRPHSSRRRRLRLLDGIAAAMREPDFLTPPWIADFLAIETTRRVFVWAVAPACSPPTHGVQARAT